MSYLMIITYTELRVSAPAGGPGEMSPSRYWSGFSDDRLVEILKTDYGFTHDQATSAMTDANNNGRKDIAWEVDAQKINVALVTRKA